MGGILEITAAREQSDDDEQHRPGPMSWIARPHEAIGDTLLVMDLSGGFRFAQRKNPARLNFKLGDVAARSP